MPDKVIVVGKNSYIGDRLSRYLRAIDFDVVSLSSSDCDFRYREAVAALLHSHGGGSATIVFLAVIKKAASNDYQSYLDNVSLVNNLIQARSETSLRSIIYLSSVDVYGKKPVLPISEQTKIDPDTWYGLAKYTCECMLMSSAATSCPVTILRIPGIFGKARSDKSVIGRMISSARVGGRIAIGGGGEALRDYVYLDDLCELISLLIPKRYRGVINVATGESQSILEIAKCINKTLHAEFKVDIESGRNARSFDLAFDNGKLRSLFPEFRFSKLEDGIRSYV